MRLAGVLTRSTGGRRGAEKERGWWRRAGETPVPADWERRWARGSLETRPLRYFHSLRDLIFLLKTASCSEGAGGPRLAARPRFTRRGHMPLRRFSYLALPGSWLPPACDVTALRGLNTHCESLYGTLKTAIRVSCPVGSTGPSCSPCHTSTGDIVGHYRTLNILAIPWYTI